MIGMGFALVSLRQLFLLFVALMVFVSVAARPPGTMLSVVGETLTMELCIGAQVETVAVNLDPRDDRQVDISCDAFTTPVAMLPALSGPVDTFVRTVSVIKHPLQPMRAHASPAWPPYISRAPPLLS
ncbi:MAG: hypothetical protein Rhims3KO_35730 [Hyphomicrobiales bacterium]